MLCGRCAAVCPAGAHMITAGEEHRFLREKCLLCGTCTALRCKALEMAGRTVSAGEVLKEAAKDKLFYDRSGGGITLSGGEPLFQADFCEALLKGAKEAGIHTCVETSGYAPLSVLARIAPYADLFLFDIKETDPVRHKQFTGQDNSLILRNLSYLDGIGKAVVLRCPIIPGYNDRPDHFAEIAGTANRLSHVLRIEIEPYHAFGEGKYLSLGRPDRGFARPSEEPDPEEWRGMIRAGTEVEVRNA